MHSTRIATFLLGAWIGCCVFIDLLALENFRLIGAVLRSATTPAAAMIQRTGREQVGLLLRYFAAEQYRTYFFNWELIQILGALALAGVLYVAAEKRAIPQMLCGLMLFLVVFQLAIHSELVFRGRDADFPPGSQLLGTQARVWILLEVWMGAEGAKLLIGALLASQMFAYKSRRRSRRVSDEILVNGRTESLGEPV